MEGKKIPLDRDDVEEWKELEASEIVVEQWVRDACSECEHVGKSWSCPPAAPEVEQARKLIFKFKHALVVLFKSSFDRKALEKAVLDIEAGLKSNGHPKAMGFFVSPCTACSECSYPDECPEKARCRPTGESWGIDLISTARKAGIKIEIVGKGEDFKPVTVFLVE